MVKIRLVRMGNNKKPFFRIVVSDVKKKVNGRFIESVGWYDPKQSNKNFEVDLARVDHWIALGAQMTDSVSTLVKKQRKAAPASATA